MTPNSTRIALHDAPALPGDPRPGTATLDMTALGVLGIELLAAVGTRTVLRMPAPASEDRGLLLVLAESAASTGAGMAAATRAEAGARAFGAELNAHFVGDPARPGTVIAIASPLLVDPARQVWQVHVFDMLDELVLLARCTLGVVAGSGPGPRPGELRDPVPAATSPTSDQAR